MRKLSKSFQAQRIRLYNELVRARLGYVEFDDRLYGYASKRGGRG